MKPKLAKRFYEVLVLLRVLGQVQGDKVPAQTFEDTNIHNLEMVDLRRKVMYHLCVMCDFEKGGDSVTAIAMENLPSGPRYRFAANGNLSKIEKFLRGILELLERQGDAPGRGDPLEKQLFLKFVQFQRSRLKEYWKILRSYVSSELDRIALTPRSGTNVEHYKTWLQNLRQPLDEIEDFHELVRFAYDTRHSKYLRVGYDPVTESPDKMENASRLKLRHYVGRLSAISRASKVLAESAVSQPDLFSGFTLRSEKAESACERPAPHAGLTLPGISGRMFADNPEALQDFREALKRLDDQGSIMGRVMNHYNDRTWRPRVHAELQLLETLHYAKCKFYDDDKFIACSKPACFCCFHYICEHPGSFTRPSCHNKVYLNWSPPNLAMISEERRHRQHVLMNSVTKHVRQAVIFKVLNADRGRQWHPDSSTGITPSLAPHLEDFQVTRSPSSSREPSPSALSPAKSSEDESEDGGVTLSGEVVPCNSLGELIWYA